MGTEPAERAADSDVTIARHRRRRRRKHSTHSRSRHRDPLVIAERAVVITATLATIFFYGVALTHAGALWRDEMNSLGTAGAPTLGEMWRLQEFESSPFGWMLALRIWMAGFGTTDLAFRLFGVLGGLALPAAIWFALRRLTRSAPLASLALVAVNPEIVRWTASVRAWGAGAALAIVTMVLVREASVALTRRRIVFATIAAVIAVQMTYQNAVLLAGVVGAAAVVAAVRRRWAEAVVPIGIGAVAAVSMLPYVGVFQRRAGWNGLGELPATFGDLVGRAWDVATASGTLVVTCGLALLVMGLGAALQWAAAPNADSANRTRRGVANYAAAAAVLCAFALLVFYRLLSYTTQAWYYVGLLAFMAVCAEIAVASAIAARMARIALVVLACIVLAGGAMPAWRALHEPHTNIDAVAAYLNDRTEAGDLVVVNPWVLGLTMTRYYHGPAPFETIPPLADHSVHRYDLIKAAMMAQDPMAPLLAEMQQALTSGHRVWIVGGLHVDRSGTPPPRLPPPPLPDSRWNVRPYETMWTREAGAFLGAHVLEGRQFTLPAAGGRFENVNLLMLNGWK